MITIWGRSSSFNVQKVMWLVGELGLEHRHIEVGGAFGGLDTPEFLALNPHGRVPVVQDGDVAVWESHSILRYLAARFGAGRFWSEDAAARSRADSWIDWVQTRLQPDFLNGVFWGFYRTPPAQRDEAAVASKVASCAAHFALVDSQLEGRDFMLGTAMSLADIPAGTCLYRYFNLDIERPSLPNVERWYRSLCERPAYKTHVMVPFEDLRGRLDF